MPLKTILTKISWGLFKVFQRADGLLEDDSISEYNLKEIQMLY
jgi:hypothetical protein